MVHIRNVLGAVCDDPRPECRELHPNSHRHWISQKPDLRPWNPNAGVFVPWAFSRWGIRVDFNIPIAV
jgi:hypothetical protein